MITPVLREVDSSYLKKEGYDPDTETLFVEFPSGKAWMYHDVTAEQYEDFLASESKGKWFIANIRKKPEDHPGEACG